jgi:hypothetical protein
VDVFYAPFDIPVDAMIARRSTACDFGGHHRLMLLSEARYFEASCGIDHIFVQMSPAYRQRASVHSANVASFPVMLMLSDPTWATCAENPRLAWHFFQLPQGSHAPLYANANVLMLLNASAFFLGGRSTIGWRSIGPAV